MTVNNRVRSKRILSLSRAKFVVYAFVRFYVLIYYIMFLDGIVRGNATCEYFAGVWHSAFHAAFARTVPNKSHEINRLFRSVDRSRQRGDSGAETGCYAWKNLHITFADTSSRPVIKYAYGNAYIIRVWVLLYVCIINTCGYCSWPDSYTIYSSPHR